MNDGCEKSRAKPTLDQTHGAVECRCQLISSVSKYKSSSAHLQCNPRAPSNTPSPQTDANWVPCFLQPYRKTGTASLFSPCNLRITLHDLSISCSRARSIVAAKASSFLANDLVRYVCCAWWKRCDPAMRAPSRTVLPGVGRGSWHRISWLVKNDSARIRFPSTSPPGVASVVLTA